MTRRISIYHELIYSPDDGYYYWEIQDPDNWQYSKENWYSAAEANAALQNNKVTWVKLE